MVSTETIALIAWYALIATGIAIIYFVGRGVA